jgi:hypothetical protein
MTHIPGFDAEASLQRTHNVYRQSGHATGAAFGSGVFPQQTTCQHGCQTSYSQCISNCATGGSPAHPSCVQCPHGFHCSLGIPGCCFECGLGT